MRAIATALLTLAGSTALFAEDAAEVVEPAVEPAVETAADAEFEALRTEFSRAHGAFTAGRMLEELAQLNLNPEAAQEGFAAVVAAGGEGVPPREVIVELYNRYSAALAEQASAGNDAYFAELAAREGVTVTASGLAYEVVEAAEGESPSVGSTVTVHYRGSLLDGTVFDSSFERNEPAQFPLNPGGLIDGWIEGIPLMTVGSTYRFHIPPAIGYGPQGRPPVIPGNAVLIFEVKLLSFQ